MIRNSLRYMVLAVGLVVIQPMVSVTIASSEENAKSAEPQVFVTQHSLRIGREDLKYTATAGETFIKDVKGEPEASIFSIAYTKDGVGDLSQRPVTFIFNGGPGSSAVWLHLGFMGPRRAEVPDATNSGAPPYGLVDNPLTLLRASDLVFIDPVGTGFSRALGEAKDEDYWGVDEDADSIAEFIRIYITANKRWNSPKYLAGESYGTIRASYLVNRLQGRYKGLALNGVILISPAMDVGTLPFFTQGNDIPFITHLPSYAATAHYHDKLPQKPDDFEAFIEEVKDFASGDYLQALFKGDSLSEEQKSEIVDRLHQYTGLSRTYLRQTNLRIGVRRFNKELLRDQGLTVGLLDGRFTGTDEDEAGEFVTWDPVAPAISPPFIVGIHRLLEEELEVDINRRYEVLNFTANQSWKRPQNLDSMFAGFMFATEHLTRGAAENAEMRIFVATAYHDLTTGFYAAEYMMNHSGIEKERITIKNYFGGHMMYLYPPSREQFANDLMAFIESR